MTWEYRFITIAVRPPLSQPSSSQGASAREGRRAEGPVRTANPSAGSAGRVPGVSPSYQELEFPAQYGDGSPAAKAGASALPRAKQVEQVVNRLAAEGWEYVALETLLRDQVLVMRRWSADPETAEVRRDVQPCSSWWRIWRRGKS